MDTKDTKPSSPTESQSFVTRSIKNASLLIVLQVFITITSFLLSLVLARFVNKEDYGFANVNLAVINSLILFLLKDSFRKTVQKDFMRDSPRAQYLESQFETSEEFEQSKLRSSLNMIWIGILITIPIAFFTGTFYIYFYKSSGVSLAYCYESIVIFSLCPIIEALSEPFAIKYIIEMSFKNRVVSEGIGYLARTLCLYFMIIYLDLKLLSFAIAQLIYVLFLILSLMVNARISQAKSQNFKFRDFFPKQLEFKDGTKLWIYSEQISIGKNYSFLSFLKYILSEGEKFVMISTSKIDSTSMAEYSLVSNLVSMIPRFIFAPVEEAGFNLFGKMDKVKEEDDSQLQETRILSNIIRFLTLISMFCIIMAFNYSYSFLFILYEKKWSDPSTVDLFWKYCLYLIFMGINGITESYVHAKEPPKTDGCKLNVTENYRMTFQIRVYLGFSITFSYFGAEGLILANCLNMTYRIIVSSYFIIKINTSKNNFRFSQFVKHSFPDLFTMTLGLSVLLIGYASRLHFESSNLKLHILIGGVVGALTCILIFKRNKELISQLKQGRKNKDKLN